MNVTASRNHCLFSLKSFAVFLLLLGSARSLFAAATVTSFGAFSRNNYNQNSASSINTGFKGFYAEVLGANLGDLMTRRFVDTNANVTDFSAAPNGTNATRTFISNDEATRNADYPAGNYTITLNSESVTLGITADVFPNAPMIQGGTWSDSRLQVSDAGYTFQLNTPVNADLVRLYIYQQSGAFKQYYFSGDGNTNSFTVSGEDLDLGVNYGGAIDFINSTDTKTGFGGATGVGGYMSRLEFQFAVVSVPEPATSSVIFTGLIAILFLRRKIN